jgi:lysophospholipase L1-like esterase
MNLILRFSTLLILMVCYKFIPVFEPKGVNYILSLINLGLIANECKKTWATVNLSNSIKLIIRRIGYFGLIVIIIIPVILMIHKEDPAGNIRLLRIILIISLLFVGGKLISIISKSRVSSYLKNTSVIVFSSISLVAVIEIIFMFISLSHGSGEAFSGKIWGARYWNPINKLGFRDEEPINGNYNVFFIGDSFTAGWGVKNIQNRFGETTAKELRKTGKIINEINLGKYGADTRLEFHVFKKFIDKSDIKPNHIVLQFFVNDMDKFFPKNKTCVQEHTALPIWKKTIIEGSYLANYIYSIYPPNTYKPLPKECQYTEILKKVFENNTLWGKEEKQLDKFKNYCSEQNIKMTLVFFPFMEDLNLAKKIGIEKRVIKYCKKNKIKLFNVTNFIKNISRKERQVSSMDSHASAKVHEITGKNLAKHINF